MQNRRISHAKCESALDSANPQNLARSAKSFCYFWLLPKVESFLSLKTQIHQRFYNSAESTLDSTIPQNLTRKTQNRRISHTKCETAPDSANSQNLARSAKSFCYFWLLPKVESSLPYQPQLTSDSTIPQNLTRKNTESTLDSTIPQNLPRKAQNHRISHAVRKSFCYFLLSQKVESFLSYQPQLTKKGNFAESKIKFSATICALKLFLGF